MKTVIEMNSITHSYHTKHQRIDLFDDLSLSFKEGEFTVLYGPSGSGKTSILNLIAGFLKPAEGKILFKGKEDIAEFSESKICEYRNKNIGYVFQFFNLIQQFNVRDNVAVPLILSGVNAREQKIKVDEMLQKVQLGHRSTHYYYQLSGGEQQRVAIARALVNDPVILLADEPTGNLDKKTGKTIVDLISKIRLENRTIIVASHDEKVTEQADRIINMDEIC